MLDQGSGPLGILLAAGRGRRFDPSGAANKLLQLLATGEPVVTASARNLLASVGRVIAVVAPHDGGVGEALRALGCSVTVCLDADSGMAASLVHALRHAGPQPGGWVIALGDMPYVQPATLASLVHALAGGARIAVPVCGGRRGNPVAFGPDAWEALLALRGDQGARGLIAAGQVSEVAVDDAGIFSDIDTPSDLPKTSTLA